MKLHKKKEKRSFFRTLMKLMKCKTFRKLVDAAIFALILFCIGKAVNQPDKK